MTRHFLRCSVRELLVLVTVFATLLAVLAPRFQRVHREWRSFLLQQKLLTAAADGDRQTVADALADGADVNAYGEGFHTALGSACRAKKHALVDQLLKAGADPDQMFPADPRLAGGEPAIVFPLAYAVGKNDLGLARRLLEAGADPDRSQVIFHCVENGLEPMLRLLLRQGANVEAIVKPEAPLSSATVTHTRPQSPLHAAIESKLSPERKLRIVQVLLEHGADTQARMAGRDAMDLAVRRGDSALADLLRQYGARYTAREAAAFNRLDELRRMLEKDRGLINARFPEYFAARPGQGPTLLGIALSRSHREMAIFLLEQGAPVDGPEGLGGTLLHQAAIGGDPELIKVVVARGLDVNARDDYQDTPLHEAAARGHREAVAALLELGAEVNARRRDSTIPLHIAVSRKDAAIAKLLLAAGGDPLLQDSRGLTPKDLAQEEGNLKVSQLFQQAVAANFRPSK